MGYKYGPGPAAWGLGFTLALLAVSPAPAGEIARYERGLRSIPDVLSKLDGYARAADRGVLVFVFEQADFCKRGHLFDETDYHAQLGSWCEGIETWAQTRGIRVMVALTGSKAPHPVRRKGTLRKALLRDAARWRLVPPKRWLSRLFRVPKAKRGALVYVAGESDPEDWSLAGLGLPQAGRVRGRPPWDFEPVARSLRRTGAILYVVAPEARFDQFLPVPEIAPPPPQLWTVPAVWTGSDRRFGWRLSPDGATDCPAAYGYPDLARAVAETDGAYLFYPAPGGTWLDACPYEVGLLSRLAPRFPAGRKPHDEQDSDPVLRVLRSAGREFEDCKPFPVCFSVPVAKIRKFEPLVERARKLAGIIDAVLARLEEADRAVRRGTWKGYRRRSLAQLRYAKFLYAMAALHLEAWIFGAGEIKEFVQHDKGWRFFKSKGLKVGLWQVAMFKLSDALPAYDGRKSGSLWAGHDSPDYRAQRPLQLVLGEIPDPLRERAKRLILAGRAVMEHEAKTPWGWMVYYSVAVRFQPTWRGKGKEKTPRHTHPFSKGDEPTTPKPETPQPGNPASGGGGPTTGG